MYTAKEYTPLLGTPGFSDTLLTTHFGLYEGYVKNTNAAVATLQALREAGNFGAEYAEIKRRFGWEFGGMRLHELYFDNLTPHAEEFSAETPLAQALVAQFGSVAAWQKDFVSTGSLRGIGWALLVQDLQTGDVYNIWVNEHDVGHLVGTTPLLIMDVFEHAFVLDYGMKRAEYISAFMHAVHWEVVNNRFVS
ncbi:MAG: superoxide dismutase [Candidatus Magasanikbacteria bacterium CG10_big_fil_rev_8_21_14_0_10_43_6]|uniref:superoxide dismutase n=1 Tax=Candidatus Magasanikbacteria bacterium CG10_big_fil_rev_8_21_14_0_10_43_6 TaxID=1974650 RepID=A0A2M6W0T6_9BACT|nr:MAG: superoxide dismutase [Candidatus Magasanikbacteria bacterium CG10_big_fil_rev_8_21_14_0_10_43_6]